MAASHHHQLRLRTRGEGEGQGPYSSFLGHALGTDGKPAGLAAELDDLAKEFEDPGRRKEKRKGRRAAAEHGSPALEEEWDDEVFEALGLSEDEDNFRDSLEHAAKNAATCLRPSSCWWGAAVVDQPGLLRPSSRPSRKRQ